MDRGGTCVPTRCNRYRIRHVYKTARLRCVCGRGYTLSLCVNVERRLGLLNLGKECRFVCI